MATPFATTPRRTTSTSPSRPSTAVRRPTLRRWPAPWRTPCATSRSYCSLLCRAASVQQHKARLLCVGRKRYTFLGQHFCREACFSDEKVYCVWSHNTLTSEVNAKITLKTSKHRGVLVIFFFVLSITEAANHFFFSFSSKRAAQAGRFRVATAGAHGGSSTLWVNAKRKVVWHSLGAKDAF